MNQYFHFTLGPVQGFVAQSRRTRDFWAGSFILSWLSAVAMKAVEKQDGNIVFPMPDKAFMKAVEKGGDGPKQGCIPNRFMAEVGNDFDQKKVTAAVQAAWKALADEVWKNDLQSITNGEAKKVWMRQIPTFWDIEWAMVQDKNATNTLDRLKSWRTHLPPDEPGVKCMMMDGWQELSGAERPGEEPKKFWEEVRAQQNSGMKTDLRPGEMLCAIAFVKRRYARYFKNITVTMPDDWTIRGWPLPHTVPSVHYMAVAPWLAQLLGKANEKSETGQTLRSLLRQFHGQALKLTDGTHNEWESNIRCVREADGKREWKALDGAVFFDAMLENKNLWDTQQQAIAADVLDKLKEVRDKAKLNPASPFYAVLLMDGDELGLQMCEQGKQQSITNGLAQFTAEVSKIVYEHNGFLVYAGGDDVLALLPLEDALSCATALRKHYLSCFATTLVTTSISAAIEYAHVKMPLGKVLRDAHDLLDNVAKDGRGRDAVACRVWKPGGMALEWAQPWEVALKDCSVVIELLAKQFQENQKVEESKGEAGRFAGKFFYRIRERFDLLNPHKNKNGTLLPSILNDDQATLLMAMEYLNSGASTIKTMDEARKIVGPLFEQCRPSIRKRQVEEITKETKVSIEPQPMLEADGALLVRFLAQKGVEQ